MTDQPVMHTYRLRNHRNGYWCQVRAPSAYEACRKVGWLIGDVWISFIGPLDHLTPRECGERQEGKPCDI